MINIMSFSGIINDEKTLMKAASQRMDRLIENTSKSFDDPENIPDDEYLALGNYAVLGEKVKLLLNEDSLPPEGSLAFECLNVLTNQVETVPIETIIASLNDSVQTAEILRIFCEAASSEMVSSVSDFIGVTTTRISSTLGTLTSQSQNLVNTMSTMLTQTEGSISSAVCAIMQSFVIKVQDDTIKYDAQDFCGVNPWLGGLSFIHVANIIGTVVTSIGTIALTIMYGAVGMVISTAVTSLIGLFQKGFKTLSDPIDIYTRNAQAKNIFDCSGFEFADFISNTPTTHWSRSPKFKTGIKYNLVLPGWEITVFKENTIRGDMFVIRTNCLKHVSSGAIPTHINAHGEVDVSNLFNECYFNHITHDELLYQASKVCSCAVAQINSDADDASYLSYWTQCPDLKFILDYDSNDDPTIEMVGALDYVGRLQNLKQLMNITANSAPDVFPYSCNVDPALEWPGKIDYGLDKLYSFGRSIPNVGSPITNADWYRRLYGMHKPGVPTYNTSEYDTYSAITSSDAYNMYTGFNNNDCPSDWNNTSWWPTYNISTAHDRELFYTTIVYNLATILMDGLVDIRDGQFYPARHTTLMNRLSNCPWFDDSWLWYTSYGPDRGAYAIKTDNQNLNSAGFVYDALIVTAILTSVAISVGVAKGQLKKKAFSENRKFDNMCFDETKTDKECRFQGLKASFYSALAGQGGGGTAAEISASLEKFSTESVDDQVDNVRYAGASNNSVITNNTNTGIDRIIGIIKGES